MNSSWTLWDGLVEQAEKKLARDPGESDFDLIQRAIARAPDRLRPTLRSTRTYVEAQVSRNTMAEVGGLMEEAGYGHAYTKEGDRFVMLDMHGIALVPVETE